MLKSHCLLLPEFYFAPFLQFWDFSLELFFTEALKCFTITTVYWYHAMAQLAKAKPQLSK